MSPNHSPRWFSHCFRNRTSYAALVFVIGCSVCAAQDHAPRFEDFGFEITRSDANWSLRNPATDIPDAMMVKLTRGGSGGAIELTVKAEPAAKKVTALSKRNEAIAATNGKPEFANQKKIKIPLLSKELPGFELDWTVGDQVYHVQQCYLVNQDYLYTLSIHAPVGEFESVESELAQFRDSFRLIDFSDKKKFEKQLRKLAAECGNELNWATSWDEAAKRAAAENKSIVVFLRLQSGFDISDAVSTSALMDPEVIELLNENCIALRYHKGMQAAINDYGNYGIGPASFGSTILLALPDGKVYGDTFVSEPNLFYDFLLQNLVISKATKIPSKLSDGLERAKFHARRGQLNHALRQLTDESNAREMQFKASIHARLMQGDLALAALEKAAAAANDQTIRAEIELDIVSIELATGKTTTESALPILEKFVRENHTHERAAEAMYSIGICQYAEDGNINRAKPTWRKLIEKHPDSRWTRKSAATLLSSGLSVGASPLIEWPDREVVEAFRSVERKSVAVGAIEKAKSDAVSYLLSSQRKDGSWISPPDALNVKTYSTSHFTAAVTSVCANALIPFRDSPKVLTAIEQAVGYLVVARKQRRTATDRPVYMDYSPWGDAYSLLFLAAAIENGVVERADVQELADDLVATLRTSQKKGGGWNYLVSMTLKKTTPGNHSASFMTSAVTIALIRAKAAGIDVPEEMVDRALGCLEEMKNDDSTFEYFLFHDTGSRTTTGVEGAAGRGPLCSLALFLGGKGSKSEIQHCLDIFVQHRENYVRETGKSLMHAAPGSQGSHYLMFDYDWAAQSWSVLPSQERSRLRPLLTEMILAARSKQGGFLDNPINGWHYGTGMALNALTILSD